MVVGLPMKILHVIRQFYPSIGGMEIYAHCLAKLQVQAGDQVAVLTLNRNYQDNSKLSNEEVIDDIQIHRIPFIGRRWYAVAPSCIRYLSGYDIVHIHGVDFFVDYLVLLKIFHRRKIVLHTHGGYFHTDKFMRFKKVYFNVVTRFILRGCDKIITVSGHDLELFSKINDNLVQIDNGVDIQKFKDINKNVDFGTLLYIGRIDKHKGIDDLLHVMCRLIQKGVPVTLKIVGPDAQGMRDQLEELSRELQLGDRVFFIGKTSEEDLKEHLSKAQLFVSASHYEAFGITAVEAMASGTPCVLNNIASFREFVDDNRSGRIVNFSDHKAAAEEIANLLNMRGQRYQMMSKHARKVSQRYSLEIAERKITSVYEGVIKQ